MVKSVVQLMGLVLVLQLPSHLTDAKKVRQEIFEQDLGDAFKIQPSTEGLSKLHLKCGAESMFVELETEKDFTGVMYTRGSFYKQSEPCFVKPKGVRGERKLRMKFPFNQCQTAQNGNVFSNVVVVQHDPELITPGDSAFTVECDFRKPRSFNMEASMQARDNGNKASGSRITLANPDPSAGENEDYIIRAKRSSVFSESDSVTFIPDGDDDINEDGSGEGQKVLGTVETVTLNIRQQEESQDDSNVIREELPLSDTKDHETPKPSDDPMAKFNDFVMRPSNFTKPSSETPLTNPDVKPAETQTPAYIFVKEQPRPRTPRLPKRFVPYYYYNPLYSHGHVLDYHTPPQLSFEATNMVDYIY